MDLFELILIAGAWGLCFGMLSPFSLEMSKSNLIDEYYLALFLLAAMIAVSVAGVAACLLTGHVGLPFLAGFIYIGGWKLGEELL